MKKLIGIIFALAIMIALTTTTYADVGISIEKGVPQALTVQTIGDLSPGWTLSSLNVAEITGAKAVKVEPVKTSQVVDLAVTAKSVIHRTAVNVMQKSQVILEVAPLGLLTETVVASNNNTSSGAIVSSCQNNEEVFV